VWPLAVADVLIADQSLTVTLTPALKSVVVHWQS